MTKSLRLFLTAAMISAAACSASFPAAPTMPAPLAAIAVHYPLFGTQLLAGTLDASFEAYAVDADGVYISVTDKAVWTSSNPTVLNPSSSAFLPGYFFPAGAGTADVRATYQGMVGSLTVTTRNSPPSFLRISGSGGSGSPSLSVFLVLGPINAGQDVTKMATWASSNPNIATVEGGVVRQRGPGNVELRASYNGVSDSVWISAPPRRF